MTSKAAAFRVGLLLIAGVAGAVGLVLFLARDKVRDGARYETYFRETVQGLDVGAPVKFRGVTLGQVTEVGLVAADYMADISVDARRPEARMVVVRWVIDPKRLGRVPDPGTAVDLGLRARLSSQGITGLAYVELDFVDPRRFPADKVPWTPRDEYLPSMPSTISQVQDAAQAIAQMLEGIDIRRIVTSVQTVLDDLHFQLADGNAATALADVAALAHSLRTSAEAADLPAVVGDIRALTASLRTTLDGREAHGLLATSTQAVERLSAAVGRLPPLLTALEATIKRANSGTADVQAELAPLLRDARAAAANLRETSDNLRRYPAATLLGGPPPRAQGSNQ